MFVIAIVLAGLFTVRTITYTRYWSQHRDEPIERWMTVRYVSHSYRVPTEVLSEALGLPPEPPDRRRDRQPLGEIAAARGMTFDQLVATLHRAIAEERAKPPPDPNAPPPPPPGAAKDRGAP